LDEYQPDNDFTAPFSAFVWNFVAATYTAADSTVRMYLNGNQVDSTRVISAPNILLTSLDIGFEYFLPTVLWAQDLDDFAIFSRILSPAEISNLYTGEWPTGTGTIKVTSVPSGAGFQLAGPNLTHYSGNTPFNAANAPAGEYTITWDALLGGYQTPQSQTQILAAGGTTAFSGHYAFLLQAFPTSLSFASTIGQPPPSAQGIQISSSGGPLAFNASRSTTSGGKWLAIVPKTSITPQTLTVTASVEAVIRGLAAGTYSGAITINSPSADNTPIVVPVTFSVLLPAQLTLQPGNNTSNTGQAQTFTATLTSVAGMPITNHRVTLTVTGSNPVTLHKNTDATGVASFSYVGTNTGVDTVIADAAVDGVQILSPPANETWTAPPPPLNIVVPPIQGNQALPGTVSVWQSILSAAASERNGLGATFSEDRCYFGAVDAVAQTSVSQIEKLVLSDLAKDIFLAPLKAFSTGTPLGDILAKTSILLVQVATSDQPSEATLQFLTEQSAGYVLTQAASDYVAGLPDGVSQISEKVVKQLVGDDGTRGANGSGSNQGSQSLGAGAPPTTVNFGFSYNPWSHFMAGGIRASCQLTPTNQITNYYLMRFQVDQNGIPLGPASSCDTSPIVTTQTCRSFTIGGF
jgi:hypothetical protein